MLTAVLAHAGRAVEPHDLWSAWNLEPVVLGSLALAAWVYRRGAGSRSRPRPAWRDRCFFGGLTALALALVSPLDALSGALASAHMVQHVLLVLVAAPLLALSRPVANLVRGSPAGIRDVTVRWRRRLRPALGTLRWLRSPATVWLLHVGALWFWHAAVPYDAAVEHHLLHVAEHLTLLATGVLFWDVVVDTRPSHHLSDGRGVLLVFAMGMQSVFLSALLTFAGSSWYGVYAQTTAPWGLDPLEDQQLAGVIMWIPAGLVYVGAGLALLVLWIRASEPSDALV